MRARISEQAKGLMRELYSLEVSLQEIAEMGAVSYSTVRRVVLPAPPTKRKIPKKGTPSRQENLEATIRNLERRYPSFAGLFPEGDRYRSTIAAGFCGEDKLRMIARHSGFLGRNGFNSYHLEEIVRNAGWNQKVEWIKENYQQVLQPLQFNGYHVAQIMTNAGWAQKVKWIKENYRQVLQPLQFNGYHVAQIMTNAGWAQKVKWIKENYPTYRPLGLTNDALAKTFLLKEWSARTQRWESNRKMLEEMVIDDERISPLAEAYITRQAFNGSSREEIEHLLTCSTYDNVSEFKDHVQEIAGESSASTAPEVLARLQKTHGYSETEIKMYLVCLNKNQRGLLRWYNTGELYQQPSISLDQMAEKGFTPRESLTAEELTEQKEALDYILQAVRDKMPEYLPLWNRIIRDYGGDSSELKEEEQQEFNHSLHALRQDRQLLARIYEVLAPHENGICP